MIAIILDLIAEKNRVWKRTSSISLLSLCGSQGTRVRPRGPGAAGTYPGQTSTGRAPAPIRVKLISLRMYLPRKEVIQPHLPVRLPCYDFTPLTLHTFGASLARLGRRLRVQTTRVV